jgi:hypothetical protein
MQLWWVSNPSRINVGFLLNQAVGESRDIHLTCQNYGITSDFILKDFKGVARVGRTPQGILVQADLYGFYARRVCTLFG